MREYINANIRVIKTDLKKRTKKLSKLNSDSIREEFKEWDDPLYEKELISYCKALGNIYRIQDFVISEESSSDKPKVIKMYLDSPIPNNGFYDGLHTNKYGSKIIGNVYIGSESSVWYNCVIRADVNHVRIGKKTNIQDGTIIHVSSSGFSATGGKGCPTLIGNNVTIGHNATIHACTINDYSLVGMGSIILDGSVIEKMSFVAAGSLVPPGTQIGKEELWAGNPARFKRKINEKEQKGNKYNCNNNFTYFIFILL